MSIQDIKSDIEQFKKLLNDFWSKYCIVNNIESTISKLNNKRGNSWNYQFNEVVFFNLDIGKNIIPNVKAEEELFEQKIKISLNIKGIVDDKVIYDPITSLSFNIMIYAKLYKLKEDESFDMFSSWHLDKNIGEDEENFYHPEYHFHFGGHEMTNNNKVDFGQLFLLEAPRIAHLPLDGILAIDFIIRNFYKEETHKKLTSKPQYKNILKRAQERFWKPYIFGLASNWDKRLKNEIYDTNLQPVKLIPNLN